MKINILKFINPKNFNFKPKKIRFNIMTKLLAGFILVALFAGVVGTVSVIFIQRLADDSAQMVDRLNTPIVFITQLNKEFNNMRMELNNALNSQTEMNMKLKLGEAEKHKNTMIAIAQGLTSKTLGDNVGALDKYNEASEKLILIVEDVILTARSGDIESALQIMNGWDMDARLFEMENAMEFLISSKILDVKEHAKQNGELSQRILMLVMAIVALCILISVGIGIFMARVISKPLKKITVAAEKLSMGEISEYEAIKARDEIGALSVAFERMLENINLMAQAAQNIASGDFDFEITPKSEDDVLANSMLLAQNTLNGVLHEIDGLLEEAKKENFHATGNADKFSGMYKNIIEGVNNTFTTISERMFSFNEILDSINFPISVTDLHQNIIFVNKAVEKLLGVDRSTLLGKHCRCWNTEICDTENCAIKRLRNNKQRTVFSHGDLRLQADGAFLYNTRGDIIGQIEVIQDITGRARVIEYQKKEVERLAKNLEKLAQGQLNLDFEVGEADEYTLEEKENFAQINHNLATAVNSISSNIKDISNVLSEMASGNLCVSVMSDYKGDFVTIKDSLNSIITSFNDIVTDINIYADQVAVGARQVSDGSQALSQGAAEQASSVEELTASITQVAAQTKQNAFNSNQASELALKVKNNASVGKEHMNEMLVSMENINTAYKNIFKVIKVIDEIAFQTNILALNASVEAARAGQHGRGFAVVAEEVRNLAVRSTKSVEETTALIEDSLNIVEEGTKKAVRTSKALETIVSGIEEELVIVEEIAKASDEQATAITQINSGIEQVSRVVQNNSSTAEESAAASVELSSHANILKEAVEKFKSLNSALENKELNENVASQKNVESEKDENEEINMIKINLGEEDFGKY